MVDTLRIKRRALGGAAGAPSSLAVGELAFNEQDGGLYIGRSNGSVVQVNSGGGTSLTISDTPPGSPSAGALWWESDSGTLYVYYNDGNTSQWVDVSADNTSILTLANTWTGNQTFNGVNNVKGTTTNDSAAAGYVGEYQQALLGAATTPTVSVITTIMGLALTAGDWDVWLNGLIIPSGASGIEIELTTGSTLSGVFPNYSYVAVLSAGGNNQISLGPLRFSLAASSTVSFIVRAGSSGMQISKAMIAARRVR